MEETMTRGEQRNAYMKYTDIRPVIMEGAPDACNVFLVVEGQTFVVTPWGCENKHEAEFIRDQLCAALAKIIEDAKQ